MDAGRRGEPSPPETDGRRRFGSSAGNSLKTSRLFYPVILMISFAMSSIDISWGLPMLTGSFSDEAASFRMPSTRSVM